MTTTTKAVTQDIQVTTFALDLPALFAQAALDRFDLTKGRETKSKRIFIRTTAEQWELVAKFAIELSTDSTASAALRRSAASSVSRIVQSGQISLSLK